MSSKILCGREKKKIEESWLKKKKLAWNIGLITCIK
jgi:hypothetical protein